jgi:hypothetical protein
VSDRAVSRPQTLTATVAAAGIVQLPAPPRVGKDVGQPRKSTVRGALGSCDSGLPRSASMALMRKSSPADAARVPPVPGAPTPRPAPRRATA